MTSLATGDQFRDLLTALGLPLDRAHPDAFARVRDLNLTLADAVFLAAVLRRVFGDYAAHVLAFEATWYAQAPDAALVAPHAIIPATTEGTARKVAAAYLGCDPGPIDVEQKTPRLRGAP